MERRKQEVDSNFLGDTWQAYGTPHYCSCWSKCCLLSHSLSNSQNVDTNSLCLGLNRGLMLTGRPFSQPKTHTRDLKATYKAVCWLFPHLFQLQCILWGKTETRIQNWRQSSLWQRRGFELIIFTVGLVKCLDHSDDDLLCLETCTWLDWLLLKGGKTHGLFSILAFHKMKNKYQRRPSC